MVVVNSYGSILGGEEVPRRHSSRMSQQALLAVALTAIAAAVVLVTIVTSGMDELDAPTALLAPFEAPKPYKWTGAGEKALKSDIEGGVKAATSVGKEASYKWTGAVMKSLNEEMKKCSMCDFPGAGRN